MKIRKVITFLYYIKFIILIIIIILGIIPRSVEKLFDGVAEADEDIEFTFKVNYIEIYMEKIRDLLDPNHLKVILFLLLI